jgi:hypothetical protein
MRWFKRESILCEAQTYFRPKSLESKSTYSTGVCIAHSALSEDGIGLDFLQSRSQECLIRSGLQSISASINRQRMKSRN